LVSYHLTVISCHLGLVIVPGQLTDY
jgi:hypothetical protein